MIITFLLIIHGLVAVLLIGGITHQALGVGAQPAAKRSFLDRARAVNPAAYTNTMMVLFVASNILGGLLYPDYRLFVRTVLEDQQMRAANGLFEIKEHFGAVGMGALPAYWLAWRSPLAPEYANVRKYLTWLIAFIVWFNFLVGHFLNNIKGLWN